MLAQITESGEAAGKQDFDPFGVPIVAPAAAEPGDPAAALMDDSFGYLGGHGRAGVYGSDQVHMGARIYDPASGRFISRDSLPGTPSAPQTQNPYAYGLNSPGRFYDLDGRAAFAAPALCATPVTIEICAIGGAIIVTGGVIYWAGGQTGAYDANIDFAIEKDSAVEKDNGGSGGSGNTSGGGTSGGPQGSKFKSQKQGSGKEKSSDVPSWVKDHPEGRPYRGESGKKLAKRMLDERYGPGNWKGTGPGSEHSKIKKWGDRGFE